MLCCVPTAVGPSNASGPHVYGAALSELGDEDLNELGCNELVPRKKLIGHVKQFVRAGDAGSRCLPAVCVLFSGLYIHCVCCVC